MENDSIKQTLGSVALLLALIAPASALSQGSDKRHYPVYSSGIEMTAAQLIMAAKQAGIKIDKDRLLMRLITITNPGVEGSRKIKYLKSLTKQITDIASQAAPKVAKPLCQVLSQAESWQGAVMEWKFQRLFGSNSNGGTTVLAQNQATAWACFEAGSRGVGYYTVDKIGDREFSQEITGKVVAPKQHPYFATFFRSLQLLTSLMPYKTPYIQNKDIVWVVHVKDFTGKMSDTARKQSNMRCQVALKHYMLYPDNILTGLPKHVDKNLCGNPEDTKVHIKPFIDGTTEKGASIKFIPVFN